MKITLQVSEDTWQSYANQAEHLQALNGKRIIAPEELMVTHLDRFRHVSPGDRVIIIEPSSRQRLEEILQGGSITTSKELVQRVQALASLRIGDVKIDFTPAQWEEIKNRAERNSRTVPQMVEATVRDMESLFFNHLR